MILSLLLLLLDSTKFKIKDQFEIWQGVTTGRNNEKKPEVKKNPNGYKVINLSGVNNCSSMIDENNLVDYYPAREITQDKLLTSSDYLISCKGEVKGYSMFFSSEILENSKNKNFRGIVASNHFLVLRPRMIAGTSTEEIHFLHNLLDIISNELGNLASKRSGNAKYLTISDVGNYEFKFPFNNSSEIKKFNPIMSSYIEKLNELKTAKDRLEKYNETLSAKIIIK